VSPSNAEIAATALFALAILHTFATRGLQRLAHRGSPHARVWHLLGEVEVAFGFWALVLVAALFVLEDADSALRYVESRNFTEPMFVFAIMVMAATRPVLVAAQRLVEAAARRLPGRGAVPFCCAVLVLVPLLGSLITEPAAMTLAALMLGERVFAGPLSTRAKYALVGVLFVNVSIGGTLTPFAAPPVLMVAKAWGWDLSFMLAAFGGKAALAVTLNAGGLCWWFRRELAGVAPVPRTDAARVPAALTALHLALLVGVVAFAHHPAIFLGLFLLFLGVADAYERHQDRLILREGLLVALFLAGLVVLGGLQGWWLQPLLAGMSADSVFWGATALTAVTDNAALTYLGTLVEGLSDEFKYALVAGAVTGGGLTVIANAPNPAGLAILRRHFDDESVGAGGLLLAALAPTAVAALAFRLL
jgi:hypothetical protein